MIRRFSMPGLTWTGLALPGLALGGLVLTSSVARVHSSSAGTSTSRAGAAAPPSDAPAPQNRPAGPRPGSVADDARPAATHADADPGRRPVAWSSRVVRSSTTKWIGVPGATTTKLMCLGDSGAARTAADHSPVNTVMTDAARTPRVGPVSPPALAGAAGHVGMVKASQFIPVILYGAHGQDEGSGDATPSAAPEPSPTVTLAGLALLTGVGLLCGRRRARTTRG